MSVRIGSPSGSSSGGGITIGDPVSGGTPTDILYVDASGNLGQINQFTYDGTTIDITDKNFRVIDATLGTVFQVIPNIGFVGTDTTVVNDGNGNMTAQGGFALGSQYFNTPVVGEILSSGIGGTRGILFDWNPATDHGLMPPYYWRGNLDIQGDSSQGSGNLNFLGLSIDDVSPTSAGVFMQFNMFDGSTSGTQTSYSIFGVRPAGYALVGGAIGATIEQSGGGYGNFLSAGISDFLGNSNSIVLGDWQFNVSGITLTIDPYGGAFTFYNGTVSMDGGSISTDGLGNIYSNALFPSSIQPSSDYYSVDGTVGLTGTMTTSSLVGKTLTFKNGLITGFA